MPTTPLNTPSADLLDLPSANAPAALGATASAGTSNTPSAADHVHQIPALTGDVTKTAGDGGTTVEKIRGKTVSDTTPSTGNVLQWDGSNIVWAAPAAGGSGGGGVTFYLNNNTAADSYNGLPTLLNSVTYKELGRAPEAAATSITSVALANNGVYRTICGYVSDLMDPDSLVLPLGLWDFNIWCSTNDTASGTLIRAVAYILHTDNTTTVIGTSVGALVTDVQSLVNLTLGVSQRTLLIDDRIAVVLEATSTGNNHTVTVNFGNSTPSHTHTTIPSVGGTGLVRVVGGVIQSQGDKVLNSDFADGTIASAKIANSGVSAGTYGALTKIPVLTVNAQGQVTSASEQNIAGTSTVSRVAWSNLDSSFPYSYSNGTTVEATSITGSAYANSTFVIVGDTGLVATSTDGITWTKRTTPLGNTVDYCFRDVAYGLSKFVAVSSDSAKNANSEGSSNTVGGRIITSADGITWGAAVFTNTYFRPMGVALGVKNGSPAMMAVGTGKLTTTGTGSAVISTNGTTWTEVAEFTTFANSAQLAPLSIAYGNGKWVVVGKNGVIGYSLDTVTWTQATSGVGSGVHLDKVEYLNGKFIIVGYAGTILVSDDGVSWTAKTSGATGIALHSVAYGDSTYYVLGDNNSLLVSTDLNTWDVEAVPFSYATIDGFTILYANGRFIAGGNNGQLCGGASVTVTLGSGASFNNTKIVGPFGDAPTIQGCINLINDASVSKHYTILVPTGTYTEDLVLRANISISGISNGNLDNGVTIVGKHTYSGLSNQVSINKVWFSNLYFVYPVASDQPAANIFTFGGNYVASANFRNCVFAGGMVNGSHITANQNFIIRIDSCKFENSATTVEFSNIVANGADVYLWGTTVIDSTGRAIKTGYTLTDLYLTAASVGTATYILTPLDTTGIAVGMTVYGANITNGKGVVQSFVANTSITLDSVSTTTTPTLCSFNKVTGTLTNGSRLVTSIADSIALINVGDRVYGTGIATNTTVIAKPSGTSIQLSMPSTSSGATLLSFGKYAYVNILGGYISSYGNSTVGCEAIKIQSGLVVGLSTSIGAASTGMNGVNLTGYGATLGLVASCFIVNDTTASYYAVKGGYATLYAYSGVSYSTITGVVTYNSSVYTAGGMTAQGYISNKTVLTTDVTGTLPVANGGTGASTLTSGSILKGAGTSAITYATASDVNTLMGSQTAKFFYAAPNAAGGNPVFRAIVSSDLPTVAVAQGGTGTTTSTGTGSVVLSTVPVLSGYTETVTAIGASGAAQTISLAASNYITATLTSATACTFTMPTNTTGKTFVLLIKQPATGTATTATFTGVKWPAGTAPTITATLGRMDILQFRADGTNWYGNVIGQNYTY